MIPQHRLGRARVAFESAWRYLLVHALTRPLSISVVNEYPRSGGTWIAQLLGAALGVPFQRNRIPLPRPSVLHGHYLSPWGIHRPLVIWRDGRDLMVSWYYYSLFENDLNSHRQVAAFRSALQFEDYEDIRSNLPAFLEYSFTQQVYPRFSWTEFVERWRDREGVAYTKYEDLHADAAGELRRLIRELKGRELAPDEAQNIVARFAFAKQAGRKPGEEAKDRFLRKGVAGDWPRHFTREAREVFDRHAGDALIALGYEEDHSWVHDPPSGPTNRA